MREEEQDAGLLRAAWRRSEACVLGHQHAAKCKGGGVIAFCYKAFRPEKCCLLRKCALKASKYACCEVKWLL
jgi:hypothetical protein